MKNIRPVGLKGKESLERMKSLMGKSLVSESTRNNSKVELTKLAPDNKVYGIIRENHEYYIKTTEKINSLSIDDFKYIGGLSNKKDFAFESYAKALKKLNLKMISLNEQYEGSKVNVFENDNLYNESDVEEIDETIDENEFVEESIDDTCDCGGGSCDGGEDCNLKTEGELKVKAVNDGPKELKGNTIGDFEDVTDEPDKAPNDKSTGTEKEGATEATPKKTIKETKKPKFSILDAMERMDSLVESLSKKKSLSETKYKLKVDDPSPEPTMAPGDESFNDLPAEPIEEPGMEDAMGGGEPVADDKPFDDTPFDAGVEADENQDPKKFIEQLTGKLGQSLRTYSDSNGVDFDLEKFAINSVISATHSGEMDEEDIEDITQKLRSAGNEEHEGEPEDDFETTGASEPEGDIPSNPAGGEAAPMGGGLGENFQVLPKDHKQVFKNAKLGVTEDSMMDGDIQEDFNDVDSLEDLERVEREVTNGLSSYGGNYMDEDETVINNPMDTLTDDSESSMFDDTRLNNMIQKFLNDNSGETVSEEPVTKPAPTVTPTKTPRRRKPFIVRPNTNPNPKATN